MTNKHNLTANFSKGTFIRCLEKNNTQYLISDRQAQHLTLVTGKLLSYQVPNGFCLHGGITQELVNFHVIATAQKSLNITILLRGKLDFGYDNLMFHLDAESENSAVVVNLARPVTFCRLIHENNNVVKLHITLPLHWIESRVGLMDPLSTFIQHHLDHIVIKLNKVMLTLANEIIKLGTPESFMDKMHIEVLTKSLLYEIFKQCQQGDSETLDRINVNQHSNQHSKVDPFDKTLDDLLKYIEANLDQHFSVQQLAQYSAMSLSSLQRKFKHTMGYSIQRYIRRRRLEVARQQLERGVSSITEAAYNAGYRHPSNFTNAFKKTFGFAPRETVQQS